MNIRMTYGSKRPVFALPIATAAAALLFSALPFQAQNPELQQRLAEIKQASAANKAALARYTWQEQQTTSIKGDVKKQQVFQVRVGPDGQQQKTPIGGFASSGTTQWRQTQAACNREENG